MDKDLRRIVKELQNQGFTVTTTKKGRHSVHLDDTFVTTFAGSASDHRAIKNGLAYARRAGFVWPPPEKN